MPAKTDNFTVFERRSADTRWPLRKCYSVARILNVSFIHDETRMCVFRFRVCLRKLTILQYSRGAQQTRGGRSESVFPETNTSIVARVWCSVKGDQKHRWLRSRRLQNSELCFAEKCTSCEGFGMNATGGAMGIAHVGETCFSLTMLLKPRNTCLFS